MKMKRRMLSCAWLWVMALLVSATPVQAVSTQSRTWVSNSGTDTGSCVISAPCKTFAYAMTLTVAGGEIDCLTPGDYGNGFSITQSLTIDCGAGQVGAMTGGGFSVDAGSGSVVIIRNLTINGTSAAGVAVSGTVGITVGSVGKLLIENCKISGFPADPAIGINFAPSTSPSVLVVSDTTIDNNVNPGTGAGIWVQPGSGVLADVTVERSRIVGNTFGIVADGASGGIINGVVSDSVVSSNINNGITVSTTGSNVVLMIDHTKVNGNNFGLNADGSNAGMLVSATDVIGNATGLYPTGGGVMYSYGNNNVNGNTTTDGTFTSVISQH